MYCSENTAMYNTLNFQSTVLNFQCTVLKTLHCTVLKTLQCAVLKTLQCTVLKMFSALCSTFSVLYLKPSVYCTQIFQCIVLKTCCTVLYSKHSLFSNWRLWQALERPKQHVWHEREWPGRPWHLWSVVLLRCRATLQSILSHPALPLPHPIHSLNSSMVHQDTLALSRINP